MLQGSQAYSNVHAKIMLWKIGTKSYMNINEHLSFLYSCLLMIFIYTYPSLFQKRYKVAHEDTFQRARSTNEKEDKIFLN